MSVSWIIFPAAGRFQVADIRAAFAPFAQAPDEYGFEVEYDHENSSFIQLRADEAAETDSFSVYRPCGDERLVEAVFAFMRAHHGVFACGDVDPPMRAASEEDAAAFVATAPDAEDKIVVVGSADELLGADEPDLHAHAAMQAMMSFAASVQALDESLGLPAHVGAHAAANGGDADEMLAAARLRTFPQGFGEQLVMTVTTSWNAPPFTRGDAPLDEVRARVAAMPGVVEVGEVTSEAEPQPGWSFDMRIALIE